MGTRADFYVGRGADAEWIGSVAMDGYPTGLSDEGSMAKRAPRSRALLLAKTEQEWRERVSDLLSRRDDATMPDQGWPWPWENSGLTDYSYAFDGGSVWGTAFGYGWWDATKPEPEDDTEDGPKVPFPDMSGRMNVTLGKRSGLIAFSVKP